MNASGILTNNQLPRLAGLPHSQLLERVANMEAVCTAG